MNERMLVIEEFREEVGSNNEAVSIPFNNGEVVFGTNYTAIRLNHNDWETLKRMIRSKEVLK